MQDTLPEGTHAQRSWHLQRSPPAQSEDLPPKCDVGIKRAVGTRAAFGFAMQEVGGDNDYCNDCDLASTAQRKPVACCGFAAFLVSLLLFALSWDTLEPTEFGLVANSITGRVDLDPKNVYEGGRHFIWLAHHFLVFPKNRMTIEFSDDSNSGGWC